MSPIYFGDQPINKMYIGTEPDEVTEIHFAGEIISVSGEFGDFPPPPSPE